MSYVKENAMFSVCVLSHFSCVWLFVTSWTVACQAPLSMGFCWEEYWSGLPCPPPGDLPDPGTELESPVLLADSLPVELAGKPIALTIWIFVGKVMSLLFNMLSSFVIAFLPRSKCLLISWLQWLSAVILKPKKIKSVTASNFSPSICCKVWHWVPWS